jgi:bifunctional DNA-binding transcriptional regulator/antitoxin component of YhaV-PrlF toxin-antitoxin module
MAQTYQKLSPRDPTSKTGRVWRIAEDISQRKGRRATRGEVIDAYIAEGGNPDTASTQYWHWKNAFEAYRTHHEASNSEISPPPRSVTSAQLSVGTDGRVVIPVEMRSAMQIGTDGKVTARVVDGELRIIAPAVAIRRAQEMVRTAIPGGDSLADELIAERRAEAVLENAT